MNKPIFTITCTTCQARLAVRSASAIGAILECPRCESMVLVQPPPDWRPAAKSTAGQVGPPPLDQIADLPLELEVEHTAGWLGTKLLVIAAGALVVSTVTAGVWRLAASRPTVEQPVAGPLAQAEQTSSAAAIESPTPPEEKPSANESLENQPAPDTSPSNEQHEEQPTPSAEQYVPLVVEEFGQSESERPTDNSTADEHSDTPVEQTLPTTVAGDVKKSPPPVIDVNARLAVKIAEVDFADVQLGQVVEILAAVGGLPVTIDVDSLAAFGVLPSDPISLQIGPTTVGHALHELAAQRGLMLEVENDQVVVSTPREFRQNLRKVRYSIDDLIGDQQSSAHELAALSQRFVAPESWEAVGGQGTIEVKSGLLVVVQTGEVHQQLLRFYEKLRVGRGIPTRSRDNPPEFELTTRLSKAGKMLKQNVTVNFSRPVPLAEAICYLSKAGRCMMLVDHAALAAAETSDRVECSFTAESQPLSKVLGQMLPPLGLAYRVVGPQVIQITTTEAAADRLEVEFYPIGIWLAQLNTRQSADSGQAIDGAALAERLKSRVAPKSWSDSGGSGEIHYDQVAKSFIVLQTQPVHALVSSYINSLMKTP